LSKIDLFTLELDVSGDFCDMMLLCALGVGLLGRGPWTRVVLEFIAEGKADGKSLRRTE
jgi:hypothetical protein